MLLTAGAVLLLGALCHADASGAAQINEFDSIAAEVPRPSLPALLPPGRPPESSFGFLVPQISEAKPG